MCELPLLLTVRGAQFCIFQSFFSGDFPPFRLVFVLFVSFVVHSSAMYPVGCYPGRESVTALRIFAAILQCAARWRVFGTATL